jgi:sugar phosphate isomerase/epimerase
MYSVGAAGRGTPLVNPRPLDAWQFMDLAARWKLCSMELPLSAVSPILDLAELRRFAQGAGEKSLKIVAAGPNMVDQTQDMVKLLNACGEIGVGTLRCTLSKLLCGDRSPLGGYQGWRSYVDGIIKILGDLEPVAAKAKVKIAMENHQDADSDDLLRICKALESPWVGVTLDAGNPLSVGEDPLEFARLLLPYLANVHLKDYRMINTPQGYRLVHCAIGDGVVDFYGLFKILADRPDLCRDIEMAAWNERHIKLLEAEYWRGYGERDVRRLVPVVRLWRERGEDAEDWRTPLELGDTSKAADWEMDRLKRSVENLDRLGA